MRHRVWGAALVAVLAASGCSATTVVTGPSTTTPGQTTTVPTGSVDDLLATLDERLFDLSIAINEGQGTQTLAELTALWTAAAAQLPRTSFVEQAQHQMDRMALAVERRRPADADKAARNLRALIEARS